MLSPQGESESGILAKEVAVETELRATRPKSVSPKKRFTLSDCWASFGPLWLGLEECLGPKRPEGAVFVKEGCWIGCGGGWYGGGGD